MKGKIPALWTLTVVHIDYPSIQDSNVDSHCSPLHVRSHFSDLGFGPRGLVESDTIVIQSDTMKTLNMILTACLSVKKKKIKIEGSEAVWLHSTWYQAWEYICKITIQVTGQDHGDLWWRQNTCLRRLSGQECRLFRGKFHYPAEKVWLCISCDRILW